MKQLIVIPAYNEEEALPKTIKNLELLPHQYEIVIVNDGSIDRTADVAAALCRKSPERLHLLNLPINKGIGSAVQTGYRFALHHRRFEYVIQFDADGQHDAGYIEKLVDTCRTQALDLCIGSRFIASQPATFRSTVSRRMGIRVLSELIRLCGGIRITDPTSGFRCAGPRAWRSFANRYPEDFPEPESLFWCVHNGLKVGEIPVEMHERQGGVSSIRSLKPTYYMVKVSLAICVGKLRGKEFRES